MELPRMVLFDHLVELRRRLLWSMAAFVVLTCLSYIFAEEILGWLTRPLSDLFTGQAGRRFIYTGLTEAFLTYLKAACFSGICLSLPVWSYQIWRFIAPGFYQQERTQYRLFFLFSPVLFFLGVALAYTVICPLAWKFFLSFESAHLSVPLQFEARISEYVALMLKLMTVFGLGFQLPIVLALCVAFRLVRLQTLKAYRKYAFLIITVVAALITPPDLISPISLIVPMYALYEITLWCLQRFEKS